MTDSTTRATSPHTRAEAAQALRVSERTVVRMLDNRELKADPAPQARPATSHHDHVRAPCARRGCRDDRISARTILPVLEAGRGKSGAGVGVAQGSALSVLVDTLRSSMRIQ